MQSVVVLPPHRTRVGAKLEDPLKHWSRSTLFVSCVMLLLLLSAGVNVLQARRIQALTYVEETSTIGQRIETLNGFSVTGVPLTIALRGSIPTVVYFFSPTCAWCERNWPNIEALRAGAKGRYRLLAVTASRGTADYMRSRRIQVDVLEGLGENIRKDLGFSATPRTLVVSTEGTVTHDWRGAFTPRIERQVLDLFGITLPGVLPKVPQNVVQQ